MSISERQREIKRRRQRRKKLAYLNKKLEKATASERGEITRKIRELTPGAPDIINNWQLEGEDR